jgi:hypothetical protein
MIKKELGHYFLRTGLVGLTMLHLVTLLLSTQHIYRTNLYNLPFGLFVGVNNHFQSIIFGGVLLTEETIDAFKWTFRNFVSMMGKDAPQTILTGKFR